MSVPMSVCTAIYRLPTWGRGLRFIMTYAQEDVSCYGGLFYSGNVLKEFRYDDKEAWQCCTACNMSNLDGHTQGLKIVYHVAEIMKTDFQQLQKEPTRHGWRRCTEGFLSEIRLRTKGMYAHYSMKIALDGVLLSQPRLEKVVSWWPMSTGCAHIRFRVCNNPGNHFDEYARWFGAQCECTGRRCCASKNLHFSETAWLLALILRELRRQGAVQRHYRRSVTSMASGLAHLCKESKVSKHVRISRKESKVSKQCCTYSARS